MSENCVGGPSQQSEDPKNSVRPDVKTMLQQYPFNGLTSSQNSSRGSSPSPQVNSIPTSQLPPSRFIPTSQLPPNSSINVVTNKISQLSVQHQSLIRPQFTSTPNEAIDLPIKNINMGAGDFSPITSKIGNNTGLVQQNFQDIPLNEERTVGNTNSLTEKYLSDTQLKNENQNVAYVEHHQDTPKTSNKNTFENKFPHVSPKKTNNQLFQNEPTKNFNISPTLPSQKVCTQPLSKNVDSHQNGRDNLQSQKQRQSEFQPVLPMNLASHHFQNMQSTDYNMRRQVEPPTHPNIDHNIQSGPFSGITNTKPQPSINAPSGGNINNASFPVRPQQQLNAPSNVNSNPANLGQTLIPSHRTATNFALQTQQMPSVGINQNIPSMNRPQFNLNPMIGQPQGNFKPVMSMSSTMNQHQLGSLAAANQSKSYLPPISQAQVNVPPISQAQVNVPPIDQSGRVNITSQTFQSNYPPLPVGAQSLNRTSAFPSTNILHQNRIPPVNQAMPILAQNYSESTVKTMLHANRYPNLTSQISTNQTNIQQSFSQNSQTLATQNQKYDVYSSGNKQSNFGQYQNVVSQGFNKLWGSETYDLLQTSNILPPDKIEPPQVMLGNETLNSANCSGQIFRSTITKIPESQSLLQKSRLPLGILIHPFKDLTQLSVIQCNVIVRCRACRTYINPYVFFVDSKRWKCNLCYRINDLPEEFQYDPVSKTYGDPSRRPEIKASTIEYIAPAEYMLRPPQPAVYLFLLDVSRLAVECGYLNIFCSVLLDELVNLPGDSRTQVGFITYDSSLHFFSFAEGLSQPHEMLVLDIDDIFLPCPDNLLVNLKDRMELLKDLLQQLPTRYNNNFDGNSALGAALQAAHRMMSATGGRVTVFQASLPNIGPGALTPREDPNQRASAEVQNLKPANDFYKRLALDCSSQQIAVDLFIVNSQYVDIATISGISRFSGGCVHHFPLFKFGRPILTEKLEKCLRRYITRKIGFEAVMRIRCTRGMSIHTFHGNFFVRSTDLLSLPNVNPDAGYGMQVSIDESLSDVETVCFQAALLYTSSKGERRIRVHTLCLPVVSTLHEVINSADQQCIIGLLAKMAVDRSIESSLSDAREAFINVAIDILSSYKLSLNLGSIPNGLLAPNCLKLLPLYISALLKSPAFRTGTSTRLDDRVKAMIDMKTKPLPLLMQTIYPDLYAVHNLEEQQVILNTEEESVHVPQHLQLTSRLIDNIGAYLMDTGDHMMLYVCSGVSQVFLKEGLGVPNFNSLNDQMYEIPVVENQTNLRLLSFINYLNDDKPYRATVQIIKDNSPSRSVFLERLIEDRVENALSYHEFLQHVKAQVK